jgi:hypothetical protein
LSLIFLLEYFSIIKRLNTKIICRIEFESISNNFATMIVYTRRKNSWYRFIISIEWWVSTKMMLTLIFILIAYCLNFRAIIVYAHLMWLNQTIRNMCQFNKRAINFIRVVQLYSLIICQLENELSHSLNAESTYLRQI